MLITTVFFTLLCGCSAYKILLFFPIPGKSHGILGEGYVRILLEAGHEVTYITPIPIKTSSPGLRQIDTSENSQYLPEEMFDVDKFIKGKQNLQDKLFVMEMFRKLVYQTLKSEVVQKLINDKNEEYDVVIVEWLHTELGAGLSTVFNCPLIWSSSTVEHSVVVSLVEEHFNPAYTRLLLSKHYSSSFWDKFYDLYTIIKIQFFMWLNKENYNNDFKSVFESAVVKRGRQLPHFEDVNYNSSLILGNSDVITGQNVALPQNYKHIGGYHIKDVVDPLPQNLQQIMDDAKYGVIYFSLGSMVRGSRMPENTKRQLLDMFSELKQTVIWKVENFVQNLPKNVHVVNWAPQRSILNHTNCVLFVTHGGLLSIFETLHYGVPIVGLPFFADQFLNVDRAVKLGFGKRVDFDEDVSEKLKVAIKEILGSAKYNYRQRIEEFSKIFRNRIIPPSQELVYWVQYVVKTHGAPHLRAAALEFNWYTKLYLDLLAVTLLILISFLLIVRCLTASVDHAKID